MQRHVNDWAGTLKAAIPFLQILQCNANAVPVMEGKDNELAAVLHEATDIVEAAETSFNAGYGTPQTLVQELASVINRRSLENGSNTPDFILADYLSRCLVLFDDATKARATWYGQPMKDLEFNKVAGTCVTPEENKAAQLRALHKTPYGAALGKNGPEIVPGLTFANQHMPGHTFEVKTINAEENTLNVYITKDGGMPWPDTWNLQHTRWGFERGEYWQVENKNEADALKKRQFPAGGVIDFVKQKRKEAGQEIMEDIERKTLDALNGLPKEYEYIPADLYEEYNKNAVALAQLGAQNKHHTLEYKQLADKAGELADKMKKVKKEAIEKEAADKMAKMVASVMQVTDSFVKAAKAIQVFNREAKEADAMRKKLGNLPAGDPTAVQTAWEALMGEPPASWRPGGPKMTDKKPITNKTGFLFLRNKGVEWLFHDGCRYLCCEWDGSEWVGWQVPEKFAIKAAETQLPAYLEQYVRGFYPTK